MSSGRSKGFTLVEVLAAVALAAVGVVASLGAISAVAKGQARDRSYESLARLAIDKYKTVFATFDLTQASLTGDFTDEGIDGYSWTAAVQASDTTNLSWMTLTVKDTNNDQRSYSVTGLVFVPPASTTGAGATVTGNGGQAGRPGGTGGTGTGGNGRGGTGGGTGGGGTGGGRTG